MHDKIYRYMMFCNCKTISLSLCFKNSTVLHLNSSSINFLNKEESTIQTITIYYNIFIVAMFYLICVYMVTHL